MATAKKKGQRPKTVPKTSSHDAPMRNLNGNTTCENENETELWINHRICNEQQENTNNNINITYEYEFEDEYEYKNGYNNNNNKIKIIRDIDKLIKFNNNIN
eukprot:112493_1